MEHNHLEISDFWRLVDELTIAQAALLVIGLDPALYQDEIEEQGYSTAHKPKGYEAAKLAIAAALRQKKVSGGHVDNSRTGRRLRVDADFEAAIGGTGEELFHMNTNCWLSTVERDSLTEWLGNRGINSGFFFPEKPATNAPEYLDPNHPRYAPKLAAAVRAWEATTDPKGKSPKQALDKWLREHGAGYGLTDDEGKAKESVIEEISKIANWNTLGGAPKTPAT